MEKLDTASQITLFDWHNHIAANGHASSADNNISILTAGGAPPHILPLRKELATRLAGGLVFRINGQSDTEKRLTLERFANRRSFSLPPEVCDLLLTRLPRDIAGLTSALDDLDTFLLNEQKPLNLKQARLWLEKYQSETPLLTRGNHHSCNRYLIVARFWGEPEYRHGEAEKIGVLLTNLGTPQAPTTKAVRVYLREFLSDPKVVETPKWWWQILLNAVILPSRSPKTAAAYRQVWTDDGSPLMTISQAQRQAIEKAFTDQPVAVELGMSYGKPSLPDALRRLRGAKLSPLADSALYPQYAVARSVRCSRRLAPN